jgi:anhydro-N-acetylmuramic acid kinase
LGDPFLRRPPPKSCGREQFGADFVDRTVRRADLRARGDDLIATAAALTARTIADAYRRFLPTTRGQLVVDQVIICGGGVRNATLMTMLADALPGVVILPIDRISHRRGLAMIDQAKEAVSFAMLAAACIDGVPANLPQVTGASRPAILGRITRV